MGFDKPLRWATSKKNTVKTTTKIGFQDQLSLSAGEKYCRTLQGEHSAILLTFIELPIVIKIFVLSILSGRFTQVLLYISDIQGKQFDRTICQDGWFLNSFRSACEFSHQKREIRKTRVNDETAINVSSVCRCLIFVNGWTHRGSTEVFV